ncbi:MAG: hypothetical protein U5N86_03270 [Planctomycetota bacterium]|nr:hypothetical protein [Planctomycetota bacterium]
MDFEYCEECGKRVSASDIDNGTGGYIGVDFYCEECLPDTAKRAVSRPASRSRSSASKARVRPSRSAARDVYDEHDYEDDYYEDEYDDRPRRSSRSSVSASRRSSARRQSSRGSARGSSRSNKSNKNMMMGIGGGVVLVVIIVIAVAVSDSSKPVPTQTPPPVTAQSLPSYQADLDKARDLYEKALSLARGKGRNGTGQAGEGQLQKAVDELSKARDLLDPIAAAYENAGKDLPKPVEDLLSDINRMSQIFNKSKPIIF